MRLLDDRLLVQEIPPDDKVGSAGVIFAPDTAKEKSQRGRVIAVGPGKFYPDLIAPQVHAGAKITHPNLGRKPLAVSEGDVVLFDKYAGTDHKPKGADAKDKYLILREHDVLAVLEEAP